MKIKTFFWLGVSLIAAATAVYCGFTFGRGYYETQFQQGAQAFIMVIVLADYLVGKFRGKAR